MRIRELTIVVFRCLMTMFVSWNLLRHGVLGV